MTGTTTTPRLTLGLPVYNGERYLAESLDALLGADLHRLRADHLRQRLNRSDRRRSPASTSRLIPACGTCITAKTEVRRSITTS